MAAPVRSATTRSTRSVRRKFTGFRHNSPPTLRDELNIKQLIDILEHGHTEQEIEDEDRPIKNGKKRASNGPVNGSKRPKKIDVKADDDTAPPPTTTIPVYSHSFELGYTRRPQSDDRLSHSHTFISGEKLDQLGWVAEEEQLVTLLVEKSGGDPVDLDLGDVTVHSHIEICQLFHGEQPSKETDNLYFSRHLLRLPSVSLDDGEPDGSLLELCKFLESTGHISVSATARLVYLPGVEAPELPFQIRVNVLVSFVFPNIYEPVVGHPPGRGSPADNRRRVLSYIFHPCQAITNDNERKTKSIRNFYSILDPAGAVENQVIINALQPKELCATLLPFQRRSVKWLLEREAMTIDEQGQIIPKEDSLDTLPLFWEKIKPTAVPTSTATSAVPPSDNGWWYYNRITGSFTTREPTSTDVLGGMLCEEMGLGKTLECIALILLNPPLGRDPSATRYNKVTEIHVSEVKTNLIVTPAPLSQQWVDELHEHAPSLNVLFYPGYSKVRLPKLGNIPKESLIGGSESHHSWCTFFQTFDVVVVTYKTLQEELGVAKAPVIRPKRQAASYSHVEKARSPLVRVEWTRVFMDEVQQVGGGKTAEMVSLIPRKVSVAVSGTPAKSKVEDLSHVLNFLGIHDAVGTSRAWGRLLTPQFEDLFAQMFKKYAIRTLKASVKDELTIPKQRRYAVEIDFGKVERHIYDETLQQALDSLGVDARGVAASGGWEIDISLLRGWLRRLRQICTHPQVGHLAQRNINKADTIKSMQEVLQDLRDKNWQSLVADRRNKINIMTRRAQLLQKMEEDSQRHQSAKALLLQAKAEIDSLVEDIEDAIEDHEERGRKLKEETARIRRERAEARERAKNEEEIELRIKAKGKQRETTPYDSSDEDGDDDDDLPKTRIGDEYRTRRRNLQARLRETQILKHKVIFFLGDIYHVLEENPLEEDAYAQAEAVRKSILNATSSATTSSMTTLSEKFEKMDLSKEDFQLAHCGKGGIQTNEILEVSNDILGLLTEQGELLWNWRTQIFKLLSQKLSSDGEKADGEEYNRSLDTQKEAEAYLQAYTALIADRKDALTAERTALNPRDIEHRHTMISHEVDSSHGLFDGDGEDEFKPVEDVQLQMQLADMRKDLRSNHHKEPLKAMMSRLNEIGNRAGVRVEEAHMARTEGRRLRQIIAQQSGFMEKLELELFLFRKLFNDRIEYFRQLQEISDTVVDVVWDGDIRNAIVSSTEEENTFSQSINLKRGQSRHLLNISKDQDGGDTEEARECIFCQTPFILGIITPCAHIFCEPCLKLWIKARHNDCPICRAKFKLDMLQRIALDEEHLPLNIKGRKTHEDRLGPDRSIKLNTLPRGILDEIQTFEMRGSYGSKITHLIRHLLYLQYKEPGTKSVVFSAWSDSLAIIEHALRTNNIGCIRVDQKGKLNAAQRFKMDPEILVFLLHGERENAGLNLTCARRVWLIEPTVNHSFEVQAISRVDRMGQTASTEVFCYYIRDSVEENILRMGAKHGFSLYRADHAEDMMDISEFSMGNQTARPDSPSKKRARVYKGDFVEKADDLLNVLFPHLDYSEEDFFGESLSGSVPMEIDVPYGNAIAGPSRR